jgi:KUP system potassium uptake protein
MGLFPRVTVTHTAKDQEGQIYIPEVNFLLAAVCIGLVLSFKSSAALASAYGLAVTGTMTITSVLFFFVLRTTFNWPLYKALPLVLLFLSVDVPFLVANLFKFPKGGYVPVLFSIVVVAVMLVWFEGRRLIATMYSSRFPRFESTWNDLQKRLSTRTPGTGVFMAASDTGVPPILVHHVQRTRALHEKVLLLTVVTANKPFVPNTDRLKIAEMGYGFWRVHVYYGFMQQPDVPRALKMAVSRRDLDIDLEDLTYFLARERVIPHSGGAMPLLPEIFFSFLQRNAVLPDRYFRIPHAQVVEVGAQLDL